MEDKTNTIKRVYLKLAVINKYDTVSADSDYLKTGQYCVDGFQ